MAGGAVWLDVRPRRVLREDLTLRADGHRCWVLTPNNYFTLYKRYWHLESISTVHNKTKQFVQNYYQLIIVFVAMLLQFFDTFLWT